MSIVNNLKFGKKFIASLLTVSILGTSFVGGLHIHKKNEVERVKGYLEDFLTEDNYVDLTKIASDYEISNFNGEYLDDAMEDLGIKYVRVTDTYVYDGARVTPFKQMSAINYDNVLFTDSEGVDYYEMYEPIRSTGNAGVNYDIPEGFVLEEIDTIADPLRYEDLDNTEIVVVENEYEDSYSLNFRRK